MKKVLFLSQRIPFPPNKGDKIRSFHELKHLCTLYEVDLVTFVDDTEDLQHVGELEKICHSVTIFRLNKVQSLIKGALHLTLGKSVSEGYFRSGQVQNKVDSLLDRNEYLFLFCFSSQVAQYVLNSPIHKIMDFCDADSDKFLQYAHKRSFPMSFLFGLEAQRLSAFERNVYAHFDASIFVTEKEKSLFCEGKHLPKVHVVCNGIDADFFAPIKQERVREIVFTGDMSYHANVDAVVWFCHEVLPLLRQMAQDFTFSIVGRNPTPAVVNLGKKHPEVHVTGRVDDIRPYLARAQVAVIPLRIARGIQNKALEAMAMETPVIASRMIRSSLPNVSDDAILSFDTPRECADLIGKCFLEPGRFAQVGSRGRTYVLKNFNWASALSALPLPQDVSQNT